ncbi:hypothetical protein XELAEV_18029409mg [Xenopus laevis]|uniref:Uncharacterized protein n=1 Tax=Xenopus laevis TaxID=8355 RepID=A0A974HHI9_XENLA|nr:hypothetical protein XELAEV_18029409mg [Xenopus laevis]
MYITVICCKVSGNQISVTNYCHITSFLRAYITQLKPQMLHDITKWHPITPALHKHTLPITVYTSVHGQTGSVLNRKILYSNLIPIIRTGGGPASMTGDQWCAPPCITCCIRYNLHSSVGVGVSSHWSIRFNKVAEPIL